MEIEVKILNKEGVILPEYKCDGDAGMDIYANEDVVIFPGEVKIIDTGLQVALPKGYAFEVSPRSGISSKTHLRVNLGTVDSGYRGNIGVIIDNTSEYALCNITDEELYEGVNYIKCNEGYMEIRSCSDNDPDFHGAYKIKKGDRIAQLKLKEVPTVKWVLVDSLEESDRNSGGFGSTGV